MKRKKGMKIYRPTWRGMINEQDDGRAVCGKKRKIEESANILRERGEKRGRKRKTE